MPKSTQRPIDPEMHPGAALDMIRAAYRNEHAEPPEGDPYACVSEQPAMSFSQVDLSGSVDEPFVASSRSGGFSEQILRGLALINR